MVSFLVIAITVWIVLGGLVSAIVIASERQEDRAFGLRKMKRGESLPPWSATSTWRSR